MTDNVDNQDTGAGIEEIPLTLDSFESQLPVSPRQVVLFLRSQAVVVAKLIEGGMRVDGAALVFTGTDPSGNRGVAYQASPELTVPQLLDMFNAGSNYVMNELNEYLANAAPEDPDPADADSPPA